MATVGTEVLQPYQDKKYIELANPGALDQLAGVNGGLSLRSAAAAGGLFGGNRQAEDAAKYFAGIVGDSMTVNDLRNALKDPNFVSKYSGLGTVKSAADYVKELSAGNPNFDVNNQDAINSIAQQLEARGLNPVTQRQQAQDFVTGAAVNQTLDRAQNPQKYLSSDQTSANQQTAQRLVSSLFPTGDNKDLTDFVTTLLGKGTSPYEVSQFLQTTPQYMKAQSDQQAAAQNQQIQNAQTALNNTLMQTQQQVFERATPNIISSFMRAGRLNSSGLNSALAQAQAQLDQQRQAQLANAGYAQAVTQQGYNQQNFLNQQQQAYQNYAYQNAPAYNQQFNLQNASNFANYQQPYNQLNYLNGLNTMGIQQQYALQNYNRQQSDYERYLQQARSYQNQNIPYQLAGTALQGLAMRGF